MPPDLPTQQAKKWCPLGDQHSESLVWNGANGCQCGRIAHAVREALRCVLHCGDPSEPRSQTLAICEDCFQAYMEQGRKNARREALEDAYQRASIANDHGSALDAIAALAGKSARRVNQGRS